MKLRLGPLVRRCGVLVALAFLAGIGTAWPQAQPRMPAQAPAQTPAQTPVPGAQEQPTLAPQAAPENPGLISEMGKLIDKITPSIKGPGETLDDLNTRARDTVKDTVKDAGDTLSRLAKPGSMVSGRTICPAGSDGTPDCKAAADRLCQSKGYKEGKSLNTNSAQTCSAKVLIPGRQRKPDDCRTDNYVTTALCQ